MHLVKWDDVLRRISLHNSLFALWQFSGPRRKEWHHTHINLSACSIVLQNNTDTLLRQASTSLTCRHIPFQTFFSFSSMKHLLSSRIVNCFAQCSPKKRNCVCRIGEEGARVLKLLVPFSGTDKLGSHITVTDTGQKLWLVYTSWPL